MRDEHEQRSVILVSPVSHRNNLSPLNLKFMLLDRGKTRVHQGKHTLSKAFYQEASLTTAPLGKYFILDECLTNLHIQNQTHTIFRFSILLLQLCKKWKKRRGKSHVLLHNVILSTNTSWWVCHNREGAEWGRKWCVCFICFVDPSQSRKGYGDVGKTAFFSPNYLGYD